MKVSSAIQVLLGLWTVQYAHAFVAPVHFVSWNQNYKVRRTSRDLTMMASGIDTPCMLLADTLPDQDAFTDSINYLDDTVLTMFGAFGVIVLALIAFKSITEQTDVAIEKVLLDFESTTKTYYPKEWNTIAQQLNGLKGEERQQKLVNLMEELQQNDPAFLQRVKDKM